MLFGCDYLGGAMFPKILIDNHASGFAAGFFAETFGNCWGVADKLLATGKCPRIRIQGPWTNHKYNPKLHDKAIFAALEKCNALKKKYPNVHVQFSPICESEATGEPWRKLLDRCGDASKDVEIIASVGKDGEFSKKFMNEVHGPNKVPTSGSYQYSYDGTSTVDSDVEKDKAKHNRAQCMFFWVPAFNLKYKTKLSGDETPEVRDNDTAPPKERECKPTPDLIRSVAVLAQPKGKTDLGKRDIWKSHADRHETPPEPRAYKPVYITPVKADNIVLVDEVTNEKTVSSKREDYVDGRFRYYFSQYGYQISTRPLLVWADGKVIGTVNPAFRDGSFR